MRPSAAERQRTMLRRMLAGAGGGLSEQVQPIAGPALQSRTEGVAGAEQSFHLRGAVVVSTSDEWPTPSAIQLVRFRVRLTTQGTSTTTVKLYADGVEAASVSFASGESGTKYDTTMAVAQANNYLQTGVTAAGTDAAGIVAVAEYV